MCTKNRNKCGVSYFLRIEKHGFSEVKQTNLSSNTIDDKRYYSNKNGNLPCFHCDEHRDEFELFDKF